MKEFIRDALKGFVSRRQLGIACLALLAITLHLLLKYSVRCSAAVHEAPLKVALILGGAPLVWDLLKKILHREFGSDLLAGISIVTSVCLREYLAGTFVVLMLSGGEALEGFAIRRASSVLDALARRMPAAAHRKHNGSVEDIELGEIRVGDTIVVFPHEICPVDGTVVEGRGVMDESYLTGEPYMMSKTPGSPVLSGAINGETALTLQATKLAVDSRYAKIMEVMHVSQQTRPRIRRLGDHLGAWYTPIAVALGLLAWAASRNPTRFLAVMVVATPCPLLIAIPVAIIGSISLAARRAIIVRDPAVLEQADRCQTVIFDKTGTLTYGKPKLDQQISRAGFNPDEVLTLAASAERYSKHPLAEAIVAAARERAIPPQEVTEISERPGRGLLAHVGGRVVQITSRERMLADYPQFAPALPAASAGLECVVLIDDQYVATLRFRDVPRGDGEPFVRHLSGRHGVKRVVLLSGDRDEEVAYLARLVAIDEYFGQQSPEQKLNFVRSATATHRTLFVGDGINDAPALLAATVGVAFGQNSDVTVEAAGVVIMDNSLSKVDEFIHISRRMRQIALQSAVGGMALSVVGMILAAGGYLPPVAGAITQEVIDLVAVLNALRAAWPPGSLVDY
jgi:heavy metal translocating P-type ATPase